MSFLRLLPKVLTICLLLSSCKKVQRQEPKTILIAGAATMRSNIDGLVKEFVAENPNAQVVCEKGGSAAALVALKHGAIDIAMLSRPVAADEDDNYLRDYLIARDGLAIVVNSANPVNDLTKAQLQSIFLGKITNWKEVGGQDAKIFLVDRNQGSNVKESLETLLLEGDAFKNSSKIAASTKEMIAVVGATPTAIGFVTLRRMDSKLKALRINGVEMSKMTMLSGRYPLSRSFYLALHIKATPSAERFVAFVRSKRGQELLAKDGLLEVF